MMLNLHLLVNMLFYVNIVLLFALGQKSSDFTFKYPHLEANPF